MIYRKFEDKFKVYNSVALGEEGNVINDFVKYGSDMLSHLEYIEKHDWALFNTFSKIEIDSYSKLIKKYYREFLKTILDDPKFKNAKSNVLDSHYKKDLILPEKEENTYRINPKYFNKLKKLAGKIFLLEDEMSETVNKMWKFQLTNINALKKGDKYCNLLTAKYKNRTFEARTEEKDEFMKNLPIEYSSVNSDDFTFLFEQKTSLNFGIAGLVYNIEEGAIIAASSNDLFSTPYKNDATPFKEAFHHSNVLRVFCKDDYSVYSQGTKICTPNAALKDMQVLTVKEVLLDRSKIKPVAVFYMSNDNTIPERALELQKEYDIKEPPIRVYGRNKENYVDLEEVFSY